MIETAVADDGTMQWRFSAAWFRRPHDCTPHGIATRCGGRCCSGPAGSTAWPPRLENGDCRLLSSEGCTLAPEDKPIACLLYPALVQPRKTGVPLVVLHHLTTMEKSDCSGNHGQGPPLVEAIGPHLTELMGETAYSELLEHVREGLEYVWTVPARVAADWIAEREDMELERLPPPRSSRL